MRWLIFTLFSVASMPVFSGSFSITEYECAHMDVNRDGFRCVINESGELLVKIYMSPDAPKKDLERSKYTLLKIEKTFLESGGRVIHIRNIHKMDKSGRILEQICNKFKDYPNYGYGPITCGDWFPAED